MMTSVLAPTMFYIHSVYTQLGTHVLTVLDSINVELFHTRFDTESQLLDLTDPLTALVYTTS